MSGSKAASTAQFTDVADGKWYAEAIAWGLRNGIVNAGFTDGRFQPDTLITSPVSSWRPSCTATLAYRGHTPQGSAALMATQTRLLSSRAAEAI